MEENGLIFCYACAGEPHWFRRSFWDWLRGQPGKLCTCETCKGRGYLRLVNGGLVPVEEMACK